jgi:hypothetical protein
LESLSTASKGGEQSFAHPLAERGREILAEGLETLIARFPIHRQARRRRAET